MVVVTGNSIDAIGTDGPRTLAASAGVSVDKGCTGSACTEFVSANDSSTCPERPILVNRLVVAPWPQRRFPIEQAALDLKR